MGLINIEKKMGGGKTVLTTILAFYSHLENPEKPIYANYHLHFGENTHYSPFMFFPTSEINECMLVIDDMENMDNLERFQSVITNVSRKRNLEIYCTGQYYTQFPRKMRALVEYTVVPSYSKRSDTLFYHKEWRDPDGKVLRRGDTNTIYRVSDFFELYDTEEVVAVPLPEDVEREILKYSNTPRELKENCWLYEGNQRKREKLVKKLMKKKGWEYDQDTDKKDYDYKSVKYLYLNKIRGINQTKIAALDDTTQPFISRKIRELTTKLEEESVKYV
jgi:hypothetical protein